MRVVLDPTLLVAAFVFPGSSAESVYRLALEGDVDLITSPAILVRVARALGDGLGWESARVADAVTQIARVGEVAEPTNRRGGPVLAAAAAGGAEAVVTADPELLRAKRGVNAVAFLSRRRR